MDRPESALLKYLRLEELYTVWVEQDSDQPYIEYLGDCLDALCLHLTDEEHDWLNQRTRPPAR